MTILGTFLPGRDEDFTEKRLTFQTLTKDSTKQVQQGGFLVSSGKLASRPGHVLAVQGDPRWEDRAIGPSDLLDELLSRGYGLLGELQGNFAIAMYDAVAENVVLAVDRMGIERLTYRASSDGLCFGTRATEVRQIPGFSSDVSKQGIYFFLLLHMVPSPYTIFEGIAKLPPAHMLEWRKGRLSYRSYWKPDFGIQSSTGPRDLKSALHAMLEKSTRSLEPDERTGAFLSGGLDSSTVAGYLSQVMGTRVNTFSIGFDINVYDELQYARLAAGHFNCRSHEYRVTPEDVISVFGKIAEAYDEPFGNSSVIPTYYCAKLAAESGISRLFAGDGGDELFGGNKRYAEQKVFELYSRIPRLIREGLVDRISHTGSSESRRVLLRKLHRYVEQARVPLPQRLGVNFAFTVGLLDMLSPDFRECIDGKGVIAHMNEVYGSIDADNILDRLLAYDWRFTLADNDLRKVGTMCELAGIKVSYPMLDNELVEFSTSVPAGMKMKGLRLRSFYKDAMRGFLPDETLKKSKHGFGLPFGVWLKTHPGLADLIYSNLADMESRGIFRPGFIPDLIEQHRSGSASYYGNFIWDLSILEEWLKKHE